MKRVISTWVKLRSDHGTFCSDRPSFWGVKNKKGQLQCLLSRFAIAQVVSTLVTASLSTTLWFHQLTIWQWMRARTRACWRSPSFLTSSQNYHSEQSSSGLLRPRNTRRSRRITDTALRSQLMVECLTEGSDNLRWQAAQRVPD